MNVAAQEVVRDLRGALLERSPALLVVVLRWALVLVWTSYGPVWVVDLMVRPGDAVAVFLFVWVYLLGKAMWSAWRIFSPERRVHRELAAMVQRAERW